MKKVTLERSNNGEFAEVEGFTQEEIGKIYKCLGDIKWEHSRSFARTILRRDFSATATSRMDGDLVTAVIRGVKFEYKSCSLIDREKYAAAEEIVKGFEAHPQRDSEELEKFLNANRVHGALFNRVVDVATNGNGFKVVCVYSDGKFAIGKPKDYLAAQGIVSVKVGKSLDELLG